MQPKFRRRDASPADMETPPMAKLIGAAIVVFVTFVAVSAASYIIQPGTRGVKVTLGKAQDQFLPEGFGWKTPMITRIQPVSVRQKMAKLKVDCFSSDLQQVIMDVRVMYRIPETSVVQIYKEFAGDPFDSLVAPRVQEALKEVTAQFTAEQIVKSREKIKQGALASTRLKLKRKSDDSTIVMVEDVVVRNIDLSPELERAIEAKMVAEQEAAKSRFVQMQTEVEAETVIIRAKGEAEAIKARGEALKMNPAYLRLQIVDKWNGKSPLVVPSAVQGQGATLLLPVGQDVSTNEPAAP